MENQEVLKAIAVLAGKVSDYHSRLLVLERENKRLTDTVSNHLKGCSCHDTSAEQLNLKSQNIEEECEACSA
jgi:tRNA G26 N,N-dimethylase Trm1